MMTLAVVNLKGGTTKTTTAVFLAHALRELGRSVLLVDADPQGSALRWSELAAEDWPVPTVALPTKHLHRQLPDVAGERFELAVIDTPPLEQHAGVVMSALRVADLVIAPVAPTPIEVDRMPKVAEAVADAADVRRDGVAPRLVVLLTKAVTRAAATAAWREDLTAQGFEVLPAVVANVLRFSQAFGDPVERASASAYGDAARYLFPVPAPRSESTR